MKKTVQVLIIAIITILSISCVYADENEAKEVNVLNREINVNGNVLNNFHSEYPVFSYNYVLYIPLTWENGQIFGFDVEMSEDQTTLNLTTKTAVQTNYVEPWMKHNDRSIKVTESKMHVLINGEELADEGYPVLSYNYIQYIPLTFDVVNNKLGWEYLVDTYLGLHLSTQDNISVEEIYDVKKSNYYAMIKEYIKKINRRISEYEAIELVALIKEKCQIYDMDEMLVLATMWQESWYDAGTTYQGAIGLMQIMYYTGDNYGLSIEELYNPEINVDFGIMYLKDRLRIYEGDVEKALVAYNMGVTRVNRGDYPLRYYNGVMDKKGKIESFLIENNAIEAKTTNEAIIIEKEEQ